MSPFDNLANVLKPKSYTVGQSLAIHQYRSILSQAVTFEHAD